MVKKLVVVLMAATLAVPLVPSTGMCWYGGPPPRHHYGGHHGGHHGGDALLWGLGGLVLGTAIVATAMQPPPPPPREVVYVDPAPVTYSYAPRVVQRTCRWERYVLDGYGRTVFDRYGQPLKEYTTGPCDYPPAW